MAVGTIDDEDIDVLVDQAAGPLVVVDADRRSDPQPTLPVFQAAGKRFIMSMSLIVISPVSL